MELPAKEIPEQVRTGAIDLGFYPVASVDKDYHGAIEGEVVAMQPLFLMVPAGHPFSSKKSVDIRELENEPLIMLDRNTRIRRLVENCFQQGDMVPLCAMEVPECNTALQYISFGRGISILPSLPHVNPDKVVSIPLLNSGKKLMRKVLLLSADSGLTPAALSFREHIRTCKG